MVFLQHPRESKVAIGTARMAHLALPNSELHQGVDFSDHPRVRALAEQPEGTAVLFPGPGARDVRELEPDELKTLVVIDGTWTNARKVLQRNPLLQKLPRVAFQPSRPGNYRIRSEPAEHCVSTIEAVVEVLGVLERAPDRFTPMLKAFDRMVDTQIEKTKGRTGAPRRRKPRNRPKVSPVPRELIERREDLVLLYAEANAHPADAVPFVPPELIHLVAIRPASGDRFEALLAPRRPLAISTPHHIGVPREAIVAGEPIAAALERFRSFLRPDDLFCAWGHYSLKLVADEGLRVPSLIDLRLATSRVLRRRAGGVEQGAELLAPGVAIEPWARGRAGVRIAALEEILRALQARAS